MTGLEEIYKNYFKDVYLFIYSMSKDKHLAEDVTADTFLKAMQSIDSFRGDCDIKVWLFQIAKNSHFSFLRKYKKVEDLSQLKDLVNDTDVEQSICHSETREEFHSVLHDLTEPYKEVFTLRVFGELSFKTIGDLFGKTDNWACVTYHRARSKIREEMGDRR